MAIYAMSDWHLPLGVNKPMDIFGGNWQGYVEKIEKNMQRLTDSDYIIMNGDFSWAMHMEESRRDFEFLKKLPGIKLMSKGNHDFWWESKAKFSTFMNELGIDNVYFLQNNAFDCKDYCVCASRGWITPSDKDFKESDMVIYKRELIRLEMALKEGEKLGKPIIAALHYPPADEFIDLLSGYRAYMCVFGHLHGSAAKSYTPKAQNCHLVSADYLNFMPIKLTD